MKLKQILKKPEQLNESSNTKLIAIVDKLTWQELYPMATIAFGRMMADVNVDMVGDFMMEPDFVESMAKTKTPMTVSKKQLWDNLIEYGTDFDYIKDVHLEAGEGLDEFIKNSVKYTKFWQEKLMKQWYDDEVKNWNKRLIKLNGKKYYVEDYKK